MSENNSQSKDGMLNHIRIANEFVLKSCIYRGHTHNIYLAFRTTKKDSFFIIKLVR
jgi:hypothetical protein